MGAICILGQVSCAVSCHCKPIAQYCFANSISHTSYATLLLVASLAHLILNFMQTRQDSVSGCIAVVVWEATQNELPFADCFGDPLVLQYTL